MISAVVPLSGIGNSMGVLLPKDVKTKHHLGVSLMLANMNATVLDFALRQKIQGQNINWFIVEQLPLIPLKNFTETRFGSKTAAEIVHEAVLELTYTAHDMAPFARDMGYVDDAGQVKPPFIWNEKRRLALCAKLDAVFFHLYGITKREDVRYIYSTFPIVERNEKVAYDGVYKSCELCLAYMNALDAGKPDAEVSLPLKTVPLIL